jgi:hypothetical protein
MLHNEHVLRDVDSEGKWPGPIFACESENTAYTFRLLDKQVMYILLFFLSHVATCSVNELCASFS